MTCLITVSPLSIKCAKRVKSEKKIRQILNLVKSNVIEQPLLLAGFQNEQYT